MIKLVMLQGIPCPECRTTRARLTRPPFAAGGFCHRHRPPESEGMWHAERFNLMKKSAYFINIGRGATTKLHDLTAALEHGDVSCCALDVFEVEPLPEEHKLWTLPNVLLTPHITVHEEHSRALV